MASAVEEVRAPRLTFLSRPRGSFPPVACAPFPVPSAPRPRVPARPRPLPRPRAAARGARRAGLRASASAGKSRAPAPQGPGPPRRGAGERLQRRPPGPRPAGRRQACLGPPPRPPCEPGDADLRYSPAGCENRGPFRGNGKPPYLARAPQTRQGRPNFHGDRVWQLLNGDNNTCVSLLAWVGRRCIILSPTVKCSVPITEICFLEIFFSMRAGLGNLNFDFIFKSERLL